MFIWENDDGSVVYTGSFHKDTWDAYWHERGLLAPAAGGFPAEEPAEEPADEAETTDSDDDGEAGDEPPAEPPEPKTAKKAAKKTAAAAKKDGD